MFLTYTYLKCNPNLALHRCSGCSTDLEFGEYAVKHICDDLGGSSVGKKASTIPLAPDPDLRPLEQIGAALCGAGVGEGRMAARRAERGQISPRRGLGSAKEAHAISSAPFLSLPHPQHGLLESEICGPVEQALAIIGLRDSPIFQVLRTPKYL